MSITEKRGASLDGCREKILLAAIRVEPLFAKYGVDLVVTSGVEPYKHTANRSGHYRGDGIDVRSKTIPKADRRKLQGKIKRKLGPDYVVILENEGATSEHYHIHWSPVFHGK